MTEQRRSHEWHYMTTENQGQFIPRTLRYELFTSHLTQDGVDYLTYGIRCMGEMEGGWIQLDAVPDISLQRESVANLVNLFNRRQLSPVHFREAVLDCVNA